MSKRLRHLDDVTLRRRLDLLAREAAVRPLTSTERRDREQLQAVLARRTAQRQARATA